MFIAIGDRPSSESIIGDLRTHLHHLTYQQMFALARRMGYEMHPTTGLSASTSREPATYRIMESQDFVLRHAQTEDYSRIKCFSCGEFGHMQTRCPTPDVFISLQVSRLVCHDGQSGHG